MKYLFLILMTFSQFAIATPKNLEVWFLSIDKVAMFEEFSPSEKYLKRTNLTAQAQRQCQKVGEYCFDPQVGLYKEEEGKSIVDSSIDSSDVFEDEEYKFEKSDRAVKRKIVDCDKRNKFDIFCGKAKKKLTKKNINFEVWLDTSSTMRQVDMLKSSKTCKRELFLRSLDKTCRFNDKVKVYYFSAAKKEAGSMKSVCRADGINNMNRILSSIKKSKAKNLIIVTDIFEASEDFVSGIEAMKGKIKGIDKPIYASNLLRESKRVGKFCR